jgi:hypothetical protein
MERADTSTYRFQNQSTGLKELGIFGEYLQKEPIHQNMVIGPRNENQED